MSGTMDVPNAFPASPDAEALIQAASHAHERPVAALALAMAAVRRDPGLAECWYELARAQKGLSLVPQAMESYRQALQCDPCHLAALADAAELIRVNEYFEEALELALRLETLAPDWFFGFHNAAVCLAHLDRFAEADRHYAEALARAPDSLLTRWEHHHNLLRQGRFAEAWDAYEVRFGCGALIGVDDMAIDRPRWTGEPLTGSHILVYGEQGLGDQIMFACAVGDLLSTGARVSMLVSWPLVRLFAASFPGVAVAGIEDGLDPAQCAEALGQLDQVQRVDFVLPLGSLMRPYRSEPDRFTGKPYLQPSAEARAFWAERAQAVELSGRRGASKGDGPLRVGLCWASNPAPHRDFAARRARHKTMMLEEMFPLLDIDGIEAVSLSNVPLDAFAGAEGARTRGLADLSADLHDLDHTAALIEMLDLVITVDTSIAHLAGALGKPVCILLHHGGDPRWGIRGAANSPWYPSMHQVWQHEPGDWRKVITNVRSRLRRTMRRQA